MQHRYVALTLFACTFATLSPLRTTAISLPPVVFSEINWAGSPLSTADEWIELANTTAQDISLGNWHVLGIASQGTPLVLPENAILPAYGTYLIANYSHEDPKSTLAFAPQFVTSSVSILNTNLALVLVNEEGNIVDTVTDSGTPDAGNSISFSSMERNLVLNTWFTANTSISLKDSLGFGTPGVFSLEMHSLLPDASPNDFPSTDGTAFDELLVIDEEPALIDADDLEEKEGDPLVPLDEDDLQIAPTPQEIILVELEDEPLVPEGVPAEEPAPEPVVILTPLEPEIVTEAVLPQPASPVPELESDPVLPVPESIPQRILDYSPLRVTEFLSSPSDGIEFVEIHHSGTTGEDLPLADVRLTDTSGKQTILSGNISPGEYLVLEQPLGKLNNDGDRVTLSLSNGQILFSLTYGTELFPAPKKGLSAGLCSDGWHTTLSPSPGVANSCPTTSTLDTESSYDLETSTTTDIDRSSSSSGSSAPLQGDVSSSQAIIESTDDAAVSLAEPVVISESIHTSSEAEKTSSSSPSLSRTSSSKKSSTSSKKTPLLTSISELEGVAHGQVVDVTGTLIALPGSFGKRVAYLQGVQLYFHKADWPELALSSSLRIVGTWDFADGNRRVKIASRDDITFVREDAISPLAWESLPHDAEEDILATVRGTLARKDGDTFIFTLAHGGEVPVVDLAKTQSLSVLRVGDLVTITGVRLPYDGRMVLAPRMSDDVVLAPSEKKDHEHTSDSPPLSGATLSSPPTPYIGGGILASSIGALGYWFLRSKKYSYLFST